MSHMRKLSEPHRVAPFAKGFGGRRNTFTSERDAVEQDTDLFSGPGNADGSYQESDGPLQRFVRRYLMDATLDWFCLVFIAQVMVMSWGHMMAANAEPFMFMGYHVPAPKMQIFTSITTLPMVLKPLIGLMSDLFPIFGYNKSPYVMVTSLVGIVACILLGSAPGAPMGGGISSLLAFGPNVGPSRFSAGTVVGCCFFVNLMITTCDVLTQGKLATKVNEVSKQEEKTGNKGATNDIIAGFVIMARIGGLGSAVCCSLIITNFGAPRVYIACAIIMVALPIFVAIRGFGEKPLSSERIAERRKFFAGQKETVGLTLLLFLGCMINIFIPMIGGNSVKLNFIVSMITSALIVVPFSVFLTPVLARLNFVFFAVSAIHVDVSGALMYWMTDNAYQYPGGPNFTRFFVTFWIPAMGMVAGGFGCFMYKVLSKGWSLKQWQALNAIIWIPVLLIDIPWVNRWNIDWGLSDCWMAIIRNLLAFFLVAMRLMPYSFIIPRLCPPGMEATMSALIFGCAQMGHSVSEDVGAMVEKWFHVEPRGGFFEQHQFDQFWKVIVIQTIISFVIFVSTIPILPAIGMEDQLLANRHDAASHGSLWKRWRSKVARNGS
mmetsp:Transcript_108221/g.220964  ORF Transcript_108221/g.220964 Transcript_108221/m.220964 type:complete len:604 (-) Transcript_108221:221-2032(-)